MPAQLYIERAGSPRKALTSTKYSHRDAVVSPDGKWIAFTADARLRPDSVVNAERDSIAKLPPDRKRDEQLRNESEIFILPVAACEAQSAECTPRKLEWFGNETQVSWSPDSKQLAFVGQTGRFKNQRLYTVDVGGGKPQDLLGTWQYEPGTIEWMKNGTITMQTSMGGARGLVRRRSGVEEDHADPERTPRGEQCAFDPSQKHVVFVSTDMTHPTELYIAERRWQQ